MLSFVKDKLNPFHLAIPVSNLDESVIYYRDILGLEEGRSSNKWADFNFFGHQLVCHVSDSINEKITNPVDGENVPVPHFGVHLSRKDFDALKQRLKDSGTKYYDEPYLRFKGTKYEQETFFVKDPNENILEIKTLTANPE